MAGKRVTFDKIGNNLYVVYYNGRKTSLDVFFDGKEFNSYCRDFFNIRTRTLEEMREFLALELEYD